MITTQVKKPILAQLYDSERVREYVKVHKGFIFSHEKIVHSESIKNDLVLQIDSEDIPTKILFNGKEVKLITL